MAYTIALSLRDAIVLNQKQKKNIDWLPFLVLIPINICSRSSVIQVVLSRIQKKWRIDIIYFQIYYKLRTEKKKTNKQTNKNKKQNKQKIKTNQTNKNKKSMQSKIKQLTIYESLKLICTCKWSIHLLVFIRVIFLTTGKMVIDLLVARVTTYLHVARVTVYLQVSRVTTYLLVARVTVYLLVARVKRNIYL